MAFSLQNTSYFPLTNPLGLSDAVDPQKALELRQNLVNHLLSRLQSVQEFESSINSLTTQSPDQLLSRKPPCAPNSLFNSPGWFQHALASSLQMGLLPLPRNLLRDLCLPVLPNPPLPMGVPRINNLSPSFDTTQEVKPKPPNKPCRQPNEQVRSSSVTEYKTPSTSRQQTFRPVARKYSERPLKVNTGNRNVFENVEPQETGTLVPSLIDGEMIMGFNVWGEKRLCLPHLFRFVLHDIDLKVIDEACTKLQITCTTCSPAQLNLLHAHKILPRAVSSCGLIRKSDAERLTKYIRHKCDTSEIPQLPNPCSTGSPITDSEPLSKSGSKQPLKYSDPSDDKQFSPFSSGNIKSQNSSDSKSTISQEEGQCDDLAREVTESSAIPVIHECFGRQMGLIYPKLYSEAQSKCIKCCTCSRFFTPEQFVGHTHTVTEVDKLNHWGFDSTNWRCYLRLYTGRRLWPNSKSASDQPIESEISSSGNSSPGSCRDHNKENSIVLDGHRRLEEFKIKFAQPIKLPTALSAALRSVGLCASVAPIPPPAGGVQRAPSVSEVSSPSPNSTSVRKILSTKLQHHFSQPHPLLSIPQPHLNKQLENVSSAFGITSSSQSTTGTTSPLYSGFMPQLTLRRLWAPNDGRIKLPPPPKLLTNCEMKSIPDRLHTGPPLLLHSHRVISREAADQYDRDFIPNVCLKPRNSHELSKTGGLANSRRHRFHHRLHRSNKRDSSMDSVSRSYSQCSSGSSSSRTRSSSGGSTSSSRCSYDKSTRRYNFDSLSNSDKNMSYRSLTSFDRTNRTTPDKSSPKCGFSSPSDQHVRSRSCTLDFELRKSGLFREPTDSRQRSTSYPRRHSEESRNTSPVRQGSPKVGSKHKTSTSYRRKSKSHRNRVSKQRSKAMAAAIAAQGAASRTCPGLWARHFAKFRGSTSESMQLPNARRPNDPSGLQNSRSKSINTTPVLVTNSMNNSLPTAVLALESIWADLVRLINEYTVCVESRSGVGQAYQRLFEQLIAMQTCYATHIANLMNENQKLNEKLEEMRCQMNINQPQNSQHLMSTSSVPQHQHHLPVYHQQHSSPSIHPKRDRQTYPNHSIGSSNIRLSSLGGTPTRGHTNMIFDKSNDPEEILFPNKRNQSTDLVYRHPSKLHPTARLSSFQRNVNLSTLSTNEDKPQLQMRPNSTQELAPSSSSSSSFALNRPDLLANESPSETASQSSSTPTASETDGMNKEHQESCDDQINESCIIQTASSGHLSQSPVRMMKPQFEKNSSGTWYPNNNNNSNDRKRKHCDDGNDCADNDANNHDQDKMANDKVIRRPSSSSCGPPIFPHYSQKRRAILNQYVPVTDTGTK